MEAYADDEVLKKLGRMNQITALQDGIITRAVECATAGDKFMRSNFDSTKLVTGQLSSTEPPVQNIPHEELRRMFVSRFKGGMIGEFDYSQLHLRIIGNLAQCDGFISAYNNNVDLHSRTAAYVIEKTTEAQFLYRLEKKDEKADHARDTAKRVNFSIIFEIGAKALAIKTKLPVAQCKQIIERWFKQFPEIKQQIERQHAYAQDHGYVISPFGRVRHLPAARINRRDVQFRALRQAGDYLISNSGRYTCFYAMVMCGETIHSRRMKSKLICQVHDSIIFDIHPDEKQMIYDMVHELGVRKMNNMCGDWMFPIPFVMDCKMGPNWFKKDMVKEKELR